jgi:hypothetical protein
MLRNIIDGRVSKIQIITMKARKRKQRRKI